MNLAIVSAPRDGTRVHSLWHFKSANWDDLREFDHQFPMDEYVFRTQDPSQCADRLTEVVLAGMEGYIPFSFSRSSHSQPWFNDTCAVAVRAKDNAYRVWKRNSSIHTHSNYKAARNSAHNITLRAKKNIYPW